MLGDKVWLAVSVPIHPIGVGWGCSPGSLQATEDFPSDF